jgi:predicted metal-dependent RNase
MIRTYKSKSGTDRSHKSKRPQGGRTGTYRAKTRTSQPEQNNGKLRVMALGGLEEVGRNMTLLEYNKEIIIIDMGLQFPEGESII